MRRHRNYLSFDAKYNSVDTKLYFQKQNELLTKYDFRLDGLVQLAEENDELDAYADGIDIRHSMEKYSSDEKFFSVRDKFATSCELNNQPIFMPHVENRFQDLKDRNESNLEAERVKDKDSIQAKVEKWQKRFGDIGDNESHVKAVIMTWTHDERQEFKEDVAHIR